MIPWLIIVFSLFSWSILNNTPNSVQVFTNISVPVINILISLVYIYIIYEIKRSFLKIISVFIMTVMIAHGMYQTITRILNEQSVINIPFINKIQISNFKNKIGIYLNNNEDLAVVVPTFHTPILAYHLLIGARNVDVISLSIFEKPINLTNRYFKTNEKINRSSTFYNYVESQKIRNNFISIHQSQIDFIDDYNIQYGIIAKNSEVSELMKSKIISIHKDPITGDTFVKFQNVNN
jgi:hypothetical protein